MTTALPTYHRGTHSLGQVAEKVAEKARSNFDRTVPVSSISFNDTESGICGGETFLISPNALRQIGTRYQIPVDFVRDLRSGTQRTILNECLEREKRDKLFFRFLKTPEMTTPRLRAYFTTRYTPMDNEAVVNELFKLGFSKDHQVKARIDCEFTNLQLIRQQNNNFEIAKGDVVSTGICIRNSEVGLSCLAIHPFVLRLACTNGMTITEGSSIQTAFRHIRELGNPFRQAIKMTMTDNDQIADQFQVASKVEITENKIEDAVENLNKRFLGDAHKLTGPERKAVVDAWEFERDPGRNMFSLVNSMTRAANDRRLSAESSNNLQEAAGRVLLKLHVKEPSAS